MRSPSPDIQFPSQPSNEPITESPSKNKRAKGTSGHRQSVPAVSAMQSEVRRVTSMASARSSHRQGSPSAEQISQALRAQRCPTNKEIRPFCKHSIYPKTVKVVEIILLRVKRQ